ncbi:hypothetical protein OAB00_01400 [Akkermansiaceae bacterium]|nr:hypothetical protein [Akkermansiaceae bacterium]
MKENKAKTHNEVLVELEIMSKEIVRHYGGKMNLVAVVGMLELLKDPDNRPSMVIDKPENMSEQLRYNLGGLLNAYLFVSEYEKLGVLTMIQMDITQGAFQPQHNVDRTNAE